MKREFDAVASYARNITNVIDDYNGIEAKVSAGIKFAGDMPSNIMFLGG